MDRTMASEAVGSGSIPLGTTSVRPVFSQEAPQLKNIAEDLVTYLNGVSSRTLHKWQQHTSSPSLT